ncbi:MAG: hypothetical protein WCX88_01085 [Patescibacteria group bacterium]
MAAKKLKPASVVINKKAWVVTVDMGYGHQRASYPLKDIAYKGIINANTYPGIPEGDQDIWQDSRKSYEAISRFKNVPLIGELVFRIYDKFQSIADFYPKRNLSSPTLQGIGSMYLIKHKNWGKHLMQQLSKNPIPLVTTFFLTAFMANYNDYPGDIYCVICDADISRSWVDVDPKKSRVNYFAPCKRVVERLQLYGVPQDKIFLTGFPLPKENLGSPKLEVLIKDLSHRLVNLDPARHYLNKYDKTIKDGLDLKTLPKKADHPLTITFAVGGAGAQRELGAKIIEGLVEDIKIGRVRVNLIAGVHKPVKDYFMEEISRLNLTAQLDKNVRILYKESKQEYMAEFNQWLHTTDILWTKPSELSFYSGLGLPIIMAEPIGSQEHFNRKYLIDLGAGLDQENVEYIQEWFWDWVKSGRLAEAAFQGFLEAPKQGVYNIEKIICESHNEIEEVETISHF